METPRHDLELPDRGQDQVRLLLEAFQQRLKSLQEHPSTRHVVVFKNKGAEAGTSQQHPHSQLLALDFVPPEVGRRVRVARNRYRKTGICLLCAIIEEEQRLGERIVFEEDGFLAFAPFASAFAGEALLVPVAHAASFGQVPGNDLDRAARTLMRLLGRCRASFTDPAYNLMLHTAPKRFLRDPALHWYWQLSPRLSRPGGFELGTGLAINPLAPEDAALMLRSNKF